MGFFDSLINFAPYAEGAVQRHDQRALAAVKQQRDQETDRQKAALNAATVGHLNAESSALTNKPAPSDFAGHVFDQEGNPYIVHKDGTLSRATIRGDATPEPPPTSRPDFSFKFPTSLSGKQPGAPTANGPTGDIDLSKPDAIPQQGATAAPAPASTPKFGPRTPPEKPEPLKVVMRGGKRVYVRQSEAVNAEAPEPTPPPSSFTFPTITGADGKQILARANTKTGLIEATDVNAKAGAAGAASGQTMQTMARMGMSFNDLKQAIDQMDRYENDPRNLQKLTPGRRAMAATAETTPNPEAHGFTGVINNGLGALVGGAAQKKLGQDDPDFTTYQNNKQRVATAFTELLPRPNQQLLQLEKGLSGADVNWNPDLIKNIQGRRRGGLDVLKNILSQQGMLDESGNMTGAAPGRGGRGGAKSPGTTATSAQQLWDAAVKLHGKAKVLQEYGPRPDGDE